MAPPPGTILLPITIINGVQTERARKRLLPCSLCEKSRHQFGFAGPLERLRRYEAIATPNRWPTTR
jgi:hypothetical protein